MCKGKISSTDIDLLTNDVSEDISSLVKFAKKLDDKRLINLTFNLCMSYMKLVEALAMCKRS